MRRLQVFFQIGRSLFYSAPLQPKCPLSDVRCFSVKELSWCAPRSSPNRRPQEAYGSSTQSEKKDDAGEKGKSINQFGIVAAVSACKNRVIGINGSLPWSVPEDRRIFQSLIKDSILIIGRKTIEENPNLGHIKDAKHCIVISKTSKDLDKYPQTGDGDPKVQLTLAGSFEEALHKARELSDNLDSEKSDDDLKCWVAGGERVYNEALRHKSAKELRLSWIHVKLPIPARDDSASFARFPAKYHWDNKFKVVSKSHYPATDNTPAFEHFVYRPKKKGTAF